MREINDVVYILRNGTENWELKYSLRSLKNFPHGKAWFYGGKPKDLIPDHGVYFDQVGNTKWERVKNSLLMACQNEKITDSFWLFNDDFFILKPFDEFPYMYSGTIEERVQRIDQKKGHRSGYAQRLLDGAEELKKAGCSTLDYALHCPMLINREKGIETICKFDSPMFRNFYGNYNDVGGVLHKDHKIMTLFDVPKEDWDFVSTDEVTFSHGKVGKWIRDRFTEPSIYEG